MICSHFRRSQAKLELAVSSSRSRAAALNMTSPAQGEELQPFCGALINTSTPIALLCGSTLSKYFSILFGGTLGSWLSFHLSGREILLILAGFLAGTVICFLIPGYCRRARLWSVLAAGSMVLISTLSVWMFTTGWHWGSLLYFGLVLASFGTLLGAVGGALSERHYTRKARTKG
jgi:positive regulator of sigma E activity